VIRVVIPYAGSRGKTRLELEAGARREFSQAMLAEVLAAAFDVGRVWVVTPDSDAARYATRATWIRDPGGGQGAAVEAALREIGTRPVLVVNADLPTLTPADLLALDEAVPEHGIAIAAADDGTTNALGLSDASLFAPLYGEGSATRFRAHAERSGLTAVDVTRPGLRDDVDTLADLERIAPQLAPRRVKP
jgi:2-phospho-L-lactate guanylyltransferase